MSELSNYSTIPFKNILADVNSYKYNATAIQRVILDYLETASNGLVDIVDPTNPFIFLLEASTVNTTAAINESKINLRKQYPLLAQTEDELYLHMSDKDYVARFATPAQTKFTFLIQYNDLLNKMINVPNELFKKVTIARNTEFVVNDISFSLQYPIDIKYYNSGALEISYDATYTSPIQTLSTNNIDYTIRNDANQVGWLSFEIDVAQFAIETNYYTVQSSNTFNNNIEFTDKYYYCRVFYQVGLPTDPWLEIKTTYTDQVFDPFTPTAVLKVTDNILNVYIPQIYVNQQLLDGNIRVDIYQTKGEINVNMANFTLSAFTTIFKSIDEIRDTNNYTNAMSETIYLVYSANIVNGGSNDVSFNSLRELVINNAVGDQHLPITNVQLTASTTINGFSIIKDVDIVTNRIFLATRQLPIPTNKNLVTPANVTIGTGVLVLEKIKDLSNIYDNYAISKRLTLKSNSLFSLTNGILKLHTTEEYTAIKQLSAVNLISLINDNNYFYTPFHYVLDNGLNEFEVRAYYLDNPIASNLNFVSKNSSVQLAVNTTSYSLTKVADGYSFKVQTKSDLNYKSINDSYLKVQLSFIPNGERDYAYLNGNLIHSDTTTKERIFEFIIRTNHDINSDHAISLNNFKMYNDSAIIVESYLTTTFNLFYTTNSKPVGFKVGVSDSLVGKDFLPDDSIVITHEKIQLEFGKALNQLWTQARSVVDSLDYELYPSDIPLLYENDVYAADAVTGSIFTTDSNGGISYNLLHQKNDIVYELDADGNNVLDEHGQPITIYKHKKGDVVVDSNGEIKTISEIHTARHIDFTLIEAEYLFATDSLHATYRNEIAAQLVTWITYDIVELNNNLLEQTKIFYYPKKVVGNIEINIGENKTATIEAKQKPYVELYVHNSIYNDIMLITELKKTAIKTIYNYLQKELVSISDIISDLKTQYGQSVVSVRVSRLGGSNNFETINIPNSSNRLSLSKKLVMKNDNTIAIEEGVEISIIDYIV